jgi:hypothetical protein
VSKSTEISQASLAICDTSRELLDGSQFNTRHWNLQGVSHEQVRSDLSRLSLGDLVLRKGEPLAPAPDRVERIKHIDLTKTSTNSPAAGVAIGTFGVGAREKDWHGDVGVTLWYNLGAYTVGELIRVSAEHFFRDGNATFESLISVPSERPDDGLTNYKRTARPPQNEDQVLGFLDLIRVYRKKANK